MKKLLIAGLALASLAGSVAASAEPIHKDMLIRAQNDWRDCAKWDRRRHTCRDADWDRNRWNEHEWYGHKTCHGDHDHYLDTRGHWHGCK